MVVTNLTEMFMMIENMVRETNMPEKQKPKWIKHLKHFAKQGHDLGKNGKVDLTK